MGVCAFVHVHVRVRACRSITLSHHSAGEALVPLFKVSLSGARGTDCILRSELSVSPAAGAERAGRGVPRLHRCVYTDVYRRPRDECAGRRSPLGPQHPEGSSCPPRLPTKGEPLAFALLGTGPLAAQKPSYSSGTTESHSLLGLPSLQGAHARREAELGPGVLRASRGWSTQQHRIKGGFGGQDSESDPRRHLFLDLFSVVAPLNSFLRCCEFLKTEFLPKPGQRRLLA